LSPLNFLLVIFSDTNSESVGVISSLDFPQNKKDAQLKPQPTQLSSQNKEVRVLTTHPQEENHKDFF